MSYGSSPSIESPFTQSDLIIVLGKNIGVRSSPKDIRASADYLSNESRMNAIAAGLLYQPGVKYLFSAGKTAGEDLPSESSAMITAMLDKFPHIPMQAILPPEEDSIDTAGNAEEVAEVLRSSPQPYEHKKLLTVGYHSLNATKIFESQGVVIDQTIASEDIISRISDTQRGFMERWSNSRKIKVEKFKEGVRSLLLIVDPNSEVLRKITQRSRK